MTMVKAVVMKDGHIDVKYDKDGNEASRRLVRKGAVVEVDPAREWIRKQIERGDLDTKAVGQIEDEARQQQKALDELKQHQETQLAAEQKAAAAAKAKAEGATAPAAPPAK